MIGIGVISTASKIALGRNSNVCEGGRLPDARRVVLRITMCKM